MLLSAQGVGNRGQALVGRGHRLCSGYESKGQKFDKT